MTFRLKHVVYLAVLVAASFAGLSAQSPAPSPKDAWVYQGAFRLPRDTAAATPDPTQPAESKSEDNFGYAGNVIGYDPTTKTLLVSSLRSRIAAVSIPAPVKSDNVNDLPFAILKSTFVDPSAGTWQQILDTPDRSANPGLHSGLVDGGRLIFTGRVYYDANNNTRRGFNVVNLPLTPATKPLVPWRTVGNNRQQGMIAGYVVAVPAKWQAALKGRVCAGQASLSIVSRQSFGPALTCFDPDKLLTNETVPATMVVGYPMDHAALGPWDGANENYGIATQVTGAAFVGDYVIFIGVNGGSHCYGEGTSDPAKAGVHNGETWCFDPTNSNKGNHGHPYRYQAWAYPITDLAKVAAGRAAPWSLKPIVWDLNLPFRTGAVKYETGPLVADDAGRFYLTQHFTDVDGYASRSLIHVFSVP